MSSGFSGGRRIASQAERHAAALREVLTALPAPWVVLASRRASGADGPPWVRFVALHPGKGIALLDISGTDGAVPPFKDFLARAGISGLQGGRLPVVPVTVGADEVADVADLLDAAFAYIRHVPSSPNWCDAVVETLLAAPDLMLVELHRNLRHATPEFPLSRPTRHPDADALRTEPRFGARGGEPRLALEADEPILPLSQPRTPRKRRDPSFDTGPRRADVLWDDPRPRPRRRWPVVPTAAGLLLFAVGAIVLWYREAPSPAVEADAPASPPAAAALTPPPSPPSPSPSASTQAAVTPHAPAAKRDVDLPRAMLQPEIAATPPTPLPLPAAKLTPPSEPVRAAAAPKPVHAAAAKPHPAPASAATDAALPAPIAAVLHPEAAPVQPHASPAAAAAPQLALPIVAATPPQPGALAGSAAPPGGTVTVNGVSYVKGEQPHALGSLESSQAVTPVPPPALASNGPAAPPAAGQPREVVISRAPAPPITTLTRAPATGTASPSGAASDSAVASGPPRDIVVSPAPALPSAAAVSASSNVDAPAAIGPPSAIQVTPAPGNSSP